MTSDYNRLESFREDLSGSYSRAGDNDGGEITARFLEEIRKDIPPPVAAVHSDNTGTWFFAFCSTCKFRGRMHTDRERAWQTKEGHNQRWHDA